MQTAIQHLPSLLGPQYSRQTSSSTINKNPNGLPTPPIATRKRKRAHQYTVSYSEVQEVDSDGRLREFIVIEDTPPPTASPATRTHTNGYSASYQPPVYSAPIRTRARAAAEAQALSGTSSSATFPIPAPKKRRRENADDIGTITRKLVPDTQVVTQPATNNVMWAGNSAVAPVTVRSNFLQSLAVVVLTSHCHRNRRRPFLATIKKAITLLFQMIS